MRTKITVLTVALGALVGGAVAHGAPIPVAQYTFDQQGDVDAFQKLTGDACKRKLQTGGFMLIGVGNGTNSCVFRTSVVGDSSDAHSDQAVSAVVHLGKVASAKLQKKAYVGVGVRQSDTAGYELRVLPNSQKWQVFRDPAGNSEIAIVQAGSGKFIRAGAKPNTISIRAFSFGGASTSLVATVNGHMVASQTDSATDQPDGRRTIVSVGAKGTGAGTGISGIWDLVQVQVPNPF
jgi:hypothetical protein